MTAPQEHIDHFGGVFGTARGRADSLTGPVTEPGRRRVAELLAATTDGSGRPSVRGTKAVLRLLRDEREHLDAPLLVELFDGICDRLAGWFARRSHGARLSDALGVGDGSLVLPQPHLTLYEQRLRAAMERVLREQLTAPPLTFPPGFEQRLKEDALRGGFMGRMDRSGTPSFLTVSLQAWQEAYCMTLAQVLAEDSSGPERVLGRPLSAQGRKPAASPDYWQQRLPRSDIPDEVAFACWVATALDGLLA